MSTCVEGSISIYPELALAFRRFSAGASASALKILCLHGWVDNCATFDVLAPALAAHLGAEVVCVDLAGHGHSAHRLASAPYLILSYAHDVLLVLDALGPAWVSGVGLVGHSMGGGIASALAGAFPDRFRALVLLDNLGLSPRAAADAPAIFRIAVLSQQQQLLQKPSGSSSVYASSDLAVDQRLLTVRQHPGSQTLSREAAERLVRRALVEVPGVAAGAVRFRHDRRITAPTLLYTAEEQVHAFLRAIACPTLLVTALNGWPVDKALYAARLDALRSGTATLSYASLPGSHHLHLDPDTAPAVIDAVVGFMVRSGFTSQ